MDIQNNISKIRKFIYNELLKDKLVDVYTSLWLEMENLYLDASEAVNKNLLERFFVDYLTIQNNGVIPKTDDLFMSFLRFFRNATLYQSKVMVVKNIFRYSKYYLNILFAQIADESIRVKIKQINAYNAVDAYPFLMEVFEDYESAHINKAMLLEILDTVIGFICERNSKKPSQIALSFAGLSNEINKMLILKDYTPTFVAESVDNNTNDNTINNLMRA